ncbi:hypothetical protein PAHAL_3G195500 [Panicum hallii]|uniref:F-box domain-containing protein n=1 Tax=Panicum hallii TaxID=206008 RepID=A0A2T8KIU7_9POAL|nr:hypothetical protein PAHAL_3G195500 [Panicum hallii]
MLCDKRRTVESVLWPGGMTAEVCLCNKRRKVMPSSLVAALPDEIMAEVFLRLPIKSILRFRADCWRSTLQVLQIC